MRIKVVGSSLRVLEEEVFTTNSKDAYEIYFKFDKLWRSLPNKSVVFYQPTVNRDNPVIVDVDGDNKVTVPNSCLTKEDYLYIGVCGSGEDIIIPTIYTYVYVKRGAS